MISESQAEYYIWVKILNHHYVGGKHTHIDNIAKGKPQEDKKMIESVLHKLCKEGHFIKKPKSDGIHISLCRRSIKHAQQRIGEIGEIIFK